MGFCFWNAAGRFELAASTCAKRVKFRGAAGFLRMAMPFAGCREASSSLVVYRTCALLLPCHSEPVTDVTGVGIRNPRPLPLPLGEVAERSEDGEGKQRRAASRRPFFYAISSAFQHFSNTTAVPIPPPMHRVARPFLASGRFCISCSRVTMIRAPDAPTG